MKKQIVTLGIIVIVLLVALSGCLESKDDNTYQKGDLVLILEVYEKEILLNGNISFKLSLSNNGTNSVKIKPFFEIGASTAPSQINYNIIKPNGNVTHFDPWYNAGVRFEYTNSDLITLESGEFVSINRSTKDYPENIFDMPGNYTFQVYYNSKNVENISVPFWQGELYANETIHVIDQI